MPFPPAHHRAILGECHPAPLTKATSSTPRPRERVVATNAWAFLRWLAATRDVVPADWAALQRWSAAEFSPFASAFRPSPPADDVDPDACASTPACSSISTSGRTTRCWSPMPPDWPGTAQYVASLARHVGAPENLLHAAADTRRLGAGGARRTARPGSVPSPRGAARSFPPTPGRGPRRPDGGERPSPVLHVGKTRSHAARPRRRHRVGRPALAGATNAPRATRARRGPQAAAFASSGWMLERAPRSWRGSRQAHVRRLIHQHQALLRSRRTRRDR